MWLRYCQSMIFQLLPCCRSILLLLLFCYRFLAIYAHLQQKHNELMMIFSEQTAHPRAPRYRSRSFSSSEASSSTRRCARRIYVLCRLNQDA